MHNFTILCEVHLVPVWWPRHTQYSKNLGHKDVKTTLNLNQAIFYSICTDLLRIKDPRKSSTYPRVCLRFSRTLMHQDLSTSLRKKLL